MSDELLPCGHCGDAATEFSSDGLYGIHCANDDCACGTPMLPTREAAIAAWNRRTPTMPDSVRATMREALEFWRDMIHSSDEVNGFTTEGGRTTLVCIDAALAWIDAQEGTK